MKPTQFEIFYWSWDLLDPVNVSHNSLSHFYNWCWVQVSYLGEVYCRHHVESHTAIGERTQSESLHMRRCCNTNQSRLSISIDREVWKLSNEIENYVYCYPVEEYLILKFVICNFHAIQLYRKYTQKREKKNIFL